MNLLTTSHKSALQDIVSTWKAQGLTVGLVPTMGALHEGHLSLIKLALEKSDRCVVSIFVNPTQFAPNEDFDAYPRDVEGDLNKLQNAGAHLVYTPDKAEIYPDGMETNVKAGQAAQGLESAFRPSHFDGVVNVVSRLFEHVLPGVSVFGEKDFQQLQVIREMVDTLGLDIEIIGAPIIRDEHGLALSSRNAYLSAEELEIARQLNVILSKTAAKLSSSLRAEGEAIQNNNAGLPRRADALLAMTDKTKQALLKAGFDKVDYVEKRWNRILAAAWIGKTRLIDNVKI